MNDEKKGGTWSPWSGSVYGRGGGGGGGTSWGRTSAPSGGAYQSAADGDFQGFASQKSPQLTSSANPYMQAAGGALSIFGGLAGSSRQTKQRQRGKREIFERMMPATQKWYDKAQGRVEEIPGIVREGFAQAKSELAGGYRNAARSAVEQGRSAEAEAQASLAASGMTSGSIFQNMRMGMGAQTSRVLADIQGRLAMAMAGLTTQETSALVNAEQNVSQFYQAREVAENTNNLLLMQLVSTK